MDWEDYQSSQHPEAQSVMQEMRNAMYYRHKVLHEGKLVPWCSARPRRRLASVAASSRLNHRLWQGRFPRSRWPTHRASRPTTSLKR